MYAPTYAISHNRNLTVSKYACRSQYYCMSLLCIGEAHMVLSV